MCLRRFGGAAVGCGVVYNNNTWRLGSETGMIKRKDAKSTDLARFSPGEKVFVRISAPSHYRRAFLHDGDEDSASKVLCELATWQQIPVAILAGGNWKWEWGKCSEQLGKMASS